MGQTNCFTRSNEESSPRSQEQEKEREKAKEKKEKEKVDAAKENYSIKATTAEEALRELIRISQQREEVRQITRAFRILMLR